MLDVEAALSATLGVMVITLLTLHGVATYDDDFADVNSWLWCVYACTALLTYLLAMAMAIVKVNDIAYAVLGVSGVSSAALCLWLMRKHVKPQEPAPDTIELLADDKEDAPTPLPV